MPPSIKLLTKETCPVNFIIKNKWKKVGVDSNELEEKWRNQFDKCGKIYRGKGHL
jgi:hypothetical protein